MQCPKEWAMGEGKSEVLQGTLDLMVKTRSSGREHDYLGARA
jgi:hypothetical protein